MRLHEEQQLYKSPGTGPKLALNDVASATLEFASSFFFSISIHPLVQGKFFPLYACQPGHPDDAFE